jgi:hypothetical protein
MYTDPRWLPSSSWVSRRASRDGARRAAAELNQRRFPRAALLLKDNDGTFETWDPFSRCRLVGASLSIVIWGGLIGLAAIVFDWHLPFLPSLISVPGSSLSPAASLGSPLTRRLAGTRMTAVSDN